MNADKMIQVVENSPKGANIVVEWERNAKVKKAGKDLNITKQVRMIGRVGIEYEKLKAVKEKRENGNLPSEPKGLASWQEWIIYPFLLGHVTKGTRYLRLYKGTSKSIKPQTQWKINGKDTSLESIKEFLLSSELKKSESDCFMVKCEDLTKVHTV